MITLFHGSNHQIPDPTPYGSKIDSDYGVGFYCTEDANAAELWAAHNGGSSIYVNCYDFDESMCSILELNEDNGFSALQIAGTVARERFYDRTTRYGTFTPREHIRLRYLSSLGIQIDGYDVIYGYRLDDGAFDIVRMICSDDDEYRVALDDLPDLIGLAYEGEQYCFKTWNGISALIFNEDMSNDYNGYGYVNQRRQQNRNAYNFLNTNVDNYQRKYNNYGRPTIDDLIIEDGYGHFLDR